LQNIFINAVTSWENLRIEYPIWLEKQKRQEAETASRTDQELAEAERKAKIQEAMDAIPKVCKCGKPLDETLSCFDCKVSYMFDEASLKYLPRPMGEFVIKYALKKRKETKGTGS
jgi:hypothetical protein